MESWSGRTSDIQVVKDMVVDMVHWCNPPLNHMHKWNHLDGTLQFVYQMIFIGMECMN